MRILFQYLAPYKTGSGTSFYKLLEAYCERFPADELTVICTAGSLLRELGRFGNCRIEIVGRRAFRKAFLVGFGDYLVRRLDTRNEYDVFWSISLGLFLRSRLPQVLTVCSAYLVYPFEVSKYHPQSKLWVYLLRLFFRRSLLLTKAVVVETPLMASYVREIEGCPGTVVVLPKAVVSEQGNSGLPLPRRIAEQFERAGDGPRLLYVATNTPHKNHKVLVPMMESLRRKDTTLRLIVTLSGEEWRKLGGPAAGSLIDSGHVIPVGWIDKDELEALYRECSLCLMPSLLESLSSAHLEAMHWLRPQIAADLPYAHDTCGDAALYASPENPTEWARQVQRLLADEALRQELVRRGVERLTAFPPTWGAMAESMRVVLAGVAARNRL